MMQMRNTSYMEHKCLGFIESKPCYQHLFYLDKEDSYEDMKQKASLAYLLRQSTVPRGGRHMPLHERLSLAKALAKAALQFQGTTWLHQIIWRSSSIWFFGLQEDQDVVSLKNPYVDAEMKCSVEPESALTDMDTQERIKNRFLFCLAVILIEIAFEAPLDVLKQSPDNSQCRNETASDWSIAAKLSAIVGAKMGMTYQEAVVDFLYCFSSPVTDLSKSDLQMTFYSNVVRKLERLEYDLRKA